jgi:Arc/MetJ family transcription regulator
VLPRSLRLLAIMKGNDPRLAPSVESLPLPDSREKLGKADTIRIFDSISHRIDAKYNKFCTLWTLFLLNSASFWLVVFPMRVTIDIEEDVLAEAMAITGEKRKSPALAEAVRGFVRRQRAREFGRMIREGVFDYPDDTSGKFANPIPPLS